MNNEHKLPVNDIMNLTTDHMDARLNRCESYKNQNWDLAIISNETVFNDFRKSKKKWVQKCIVYKSLKTGKGMHKVNRCVAISRTERKKTSLN